jgi:disulfide bond formation protein DsbB
MLTAEFLNFWLALGGVGMQIVTAGMLALYFLRRRFTDLEDVAGLLSTWGLWIGFLVSFGVVATSLYYSEVLGFLPCGWCWVQRVFLWPQVLIFGIAAWRNDASVALYSIALSIFGGLAGLYQHYLQMGGTSVLPCPASGPGDCAQRFFFEFGYMTFPLMAVTTFAFLIVLMLFVRSSQEVGSLLNYTRNNQV